MDMSDHNGGANEDSLSKEGRIHQETLVKKETWWWNEAVDSTVK